MDDQQVNHLSGNNDIVGAFVFNRYLQQEKCAIKLDSIYNLFNPLLQTSYYLREMRKKIDYMKKLVIGQPVPTFYSKTSANASFHLQDLRGKYVVLDFWGTWCAPCIKGLPEMKAYYERYKSTVEFVGIACNDNKSNWRKAIKDHGLTWTQLFNGKGAQDLAAIFNVLAFPTKIILGKKGELIGLFKGENKAFYAAIDGLVQ